MSNHTKGWRLFGDALGIEYDAVNGDYLVIRMDDRTDPQADWMAYYAGHQEADEIYATIGEALERMRRHRDDLPLTNRPKVADLDPGVLRRATDIATHAVGVALDRWQEEHPGPLGVGAPSVRLTASVRNAIAKRVLTALTEDGWTPPGGGQ